MFRAIPLLFVIVPAAVLAACSKEPTPTPAASPEEVARTFMDAANSGNEAAFLEVMTTKAREGMESGSGTSLEEGKFETIEIGTAVIVDGTAEVPVTATETETGTQQTMNMLLRQENAEWRVYGMGIEMPGGMAFTLDFEKLGDMMSGLVEGIAEGMGEAFKTSFEQMMAGPTPEAFAIRKALFDGVHAISLEDFDARWVNAVDYRGRSADDALHELAQSLGLTLEPGVSAEQLSALVDVDVMDRSRMEAIELIAAEQGLYPVYPDSDGMGGLMGAMAEVLIAGMTEIFTGEDPAISIQGAPGEEAQEPEEGVVSKAALTLASGPRPFPVAFTGPFLIEIRSVDEEVPHATGTLHAMVRAYGLDEGVVLLLDELNEATRFESIEDAKGRLLNDPDVQYMSSGDASGGVYLDSFSIELRNMIREVTEIARVAGVQKALRPNAVHEINFDPLVEGATQTVGGMTIVVNQVGNYTRLEVQTPEKNSDAFKALVWAEKPDGSPLETQYVSVMNWQPEKLNIDINFSETPGKLQIKLVETGDPLEYPFEIKSIPLERYAEMPEQIEALDFGEHPSPITAELVEILEFDENFSKISIRVTNHSNKEATSLFVNFVYLDIHGNELEDFPHTLTGAFTMDGPQPLAAPGATAEQETTAFSMPDGTQSIRMEPLSVDFIDGTTWKPKDE